jgi:hypothetical protein
MRIFSFWVSFLVIVMMSSAVMASESDQNSVAAANWTGMWDSESFLYQFTEDGKTVSGTFQSKKIGSADTGWINGTTGENENVLTGFWSQVGPVLLTKDNDTTLSGTWGYYSNATNGGSFTFTGEDTDGWSGTWVSDSHIFNLSQNGLSVTGTFEVRGKSPVQTGPVEGTLNDDETEFSGTWNETGAILFTMSEDLNSFNGTHGYDPDTLDAGVWYGIRVE